MKIAHNYAHALAQLGTLTQVTPIKNPVLRHVNLSLIQELDLDPSLFTQDTLFPALFSSEGLLNQHSFAQKYGGHQFGHWNPELGDGRGVLLGNVKDKQGQYQDLHLKGAGNTPYSRFGDGRAVLRSTLREYLASEALHALGIPTSRALCLISSDTLVQREEAETAAMMIRTCPSHIRFGHFEYYFHHQHPKQLEDLFQYCFRQYYSHCDQSENPYLAMFRHIVSATAKMIAKWQVFGFAHGVMNTDNMSIHGITFDYGPYGFLDQFDPDFICNHSDHQGRYAFGQQPGVGLWNLNALACSFSPYVEKEALADELKNYESVLISEYSQLMGNKLGISQIQNQDQGLLDDLLQHMQLEQRDYTLTFRRLYQSRLHNQASIFTDNFIDREKAENWLKHCKQRWQIETHKAASELNTMALHSPKYVLRNYLAHQAIKGAEQGDYSEFNTLLSVLSRPFDEQPEQEPYSAPPPDWGRELSISCSS